MRKGPVLLVLALALLGWGAALLGRSGEGPAPAGAAPAPEPTAVLPPPAEPVPRPVQPEPQPPAGAAPAQRPDGPAPVVPLDLPPQERRRQLMEITRKQRELNAARIGVAERRFEQETRSPAWAEPHEQALQQALVRDTIDSMLMDVECRETICRVELSAIDSNAAFALKRGEQFTKELGEQIATKMQGGGFDRVLVIYSARDGSVLD